MRSVSGRGCAQGLAVGFLLAACAADLLGTGSEGLAWPTAAVLLVGLAALLWPADRRPFWLTPQLRTAVPALASGALTAGALISGQAVFFGPGEVAILLSLLFVAVRHCPPRWVLLCALLDCAALLTLPVRYYRSLHGDSVGFLAAGLALAGLVAGLAGYVRSLDYRRSVAQEETRRTERLAIAADLHDFVAHHVTGILVQTQMARMMATTRPQDLDPVLAGIERAATEALASMRRTVGVLRDTGPDTADRRPAGDLAAVDDLVAGFAGPGQKAILRRAPDLPDGVPHEVQAAAFRVVQEALTNVRRHAGDATEISVAVSRTGDGLEVTVTDNGHGAVQLPDAARGGGFGLVGLTERVTALGGELHAGPPATHGWEVRATFPLP
ncbi:sensor histidine kinase [Streptomyces arenae]|uniref:sensor histidine kinase n=1 Tax=Streptomyces arenae TaxID=29301 RepID=UPI00265969C9|nr:histidine kinase [Streptomyces arenae]MCG7202638.1 histidine kinase [Streptomyces arenae]